MVGSDPLEQSSLAIGDIDSVQEIRNASLGHINTKSDLDDIHDGSKQPRRGSSSKRGSSGRGLFFHCPQGPQGYEDVIHFPGSAFLRNLRTLEYASQGTKGSSERSTHLL